MRSGARDYSRATSLSTARQTRPRRSSVMHARSSKKDSPRAIRNMRNMKWAMGQSGKEKDWLTNKIAGERKAKEAIRTYSMFEAMICSSSRLEYSGVAASVPALRSRKGVDDPCVSQT